MANRIQDSATRSELAEQVRDALKAVEALPPIKRAIHDLEQLRSGMRGLTSFDSDMKAVNAAIDARPEYVLLAAYREAVASLTDMKAEIERLKEELDSAVDGNSRLALILNEKRVEAKDSVTRIAALETQMAHGASGD